MASGAQARDAIALRDCPICGGEAYYIDVSHVGAPWSGWGLDALGVTVSCGVCGCTIPSQMDMRSAAYSWNRRKDG